MSNRVSGVVAGSRKCGTTWLYERFKEDPGVCVSLIVKESGFFRRSEDQDVARYEKLFPDSPGTRIEVDSSLLYSPVSAQKMLKYNENIRVAVVLREPIDYAVSRYIQASRKGEKISGHITQAIVQDELFRTELDYPALLRHFEEIRKIGSLVVVPYSLLKSDPQSFYTIIRKHLTGCIDESFHPKSSKVNVARKSRWDMATSILSQAAVLARRRRLHRIVNFAKGLGIHDFLEKQYDNSGIDDLKLLAARVVETHYRPSIDLYRKLEESYSNG